MPSLSDQAMARRMLAARAEGGFRLATFLRLNARKYAVYAVLATIVLAGSAAMGEWAGFAFALGLVLGSLGRDIGWVRASGRSFACTRKVINWDLVEQLAAELPSA